MYVNKASHTLDSLAILDDIGGSRWCLCTIRSKDAEKKNMFTTPKFYDIDDFERLRTVATRHQMAKVLKVGKHRKRAVWRSGLLLPKFPMKLCSPIFLDNTYQQITSRPSEMQSTLCCAAICVWVWLQVMPANMKIPVPGKFMKIGLAVCKCEINFNNYTTTFMFAEMFDTGLLFPDSTCFMG